MFNAEGYVYDSTNHPLTFAEIAQSIYTAVYMQDLNEDSWPVEEFAVLSQRSLMVLAVTYEMMQNCPQYQIDGTVISKFSKEYEV